MPKGVTSRKVVLGASRPRRVNKTKPRVLVKNPSPTRAPPNSPIKKVQTHSAGSNVVKLTDKPHDSTQWNIEEAYETIMGPPNPCPEVQFSEIAFVIKLKPLPFDSLDGLLIPVFQSILNRLTQETSETAVGKIYVGIRPWTPVVDIDGFKPFYRRFSEISVDEILNALGTLELDDSDERMYLYVEYCDSNE